jgi:hypothetical protein
VKSLHGSQARQKPAIRFLQITWIRLAMELDQARTLIEAMQELEEEQPIKAAE